MAQDVTPDIPAGRLNLQGYGDGGFRINAERVEGSQILFPERRLDWSVTAPDQITPESLSAIRDAEEPVDILLIGCGPKFGPIPPGLRDTVKSWGAVLEWMDTGAACRTFNVLIGEERRIAAAIIAVE